MLEPAINQKLHQRLQQLKNDGKLLSRQQLEQFYGTFRKQFGPEKLASLDGNVLLETMHAHGNRESLVYWLEFKNDDEFPAPRFGSISGGSAFKFGIFRRKESGMWVTSDESNNAKDISVDEAIVIARKHRDQLLKGVELLKQLPENGSDEDYKGLQDRLDREAPDVSDLGWGHKYFHLVFPDKLDHFHSPDWQRFHLLKMLERPPDLKGRYVCAGRFVAAARELEVSMNNLNDILISLNGNRHRYWRVGTRSGDTKLSYWDMMKERNCVAVGWSQLGDLSWVESNKASREKLKALLEEKYPNHPSAIGNDCSQITQFVADMSIGDIVLAADGATILGIGKLVGKYQHEDFDFPHQRAVEWLRLDEWKMPVNEGLRTTVREIKRHSENILEIERRIQGAPPLVRPPVQSNQAGKTGSRQLPRLEGVAGRIQDVLERKGQLILYGPPGTGKTFWAGRTAFDLAAHWEFGKPFDQLVEHEKQAVEGGNQGGGLVRLCCFHPAYGYEDFIEGYRPETTVNDQIAFRLRDGVFKRLAKDAAQTPDRKFFLIVDEINRGDIPRIFGELLTVLEKDKRGKAILLPVSGETFRVPQNIYLIGTMNTADRSISLLDAALRRRFGFIELMPEYEVLRGHAISGIPLGPWLEALNRRICEHVGRDARNLQIGHSYLMQGDRPLKDLAALKCALRDDIIPLLEEYCYEDFSALQNILGNGLVDSEKKRIRHELFEDRQETELLQAFRDPEILTSPEALSADKPDNDVSGDDEGGEEAIQK